MSATVSVDNATPARGSNVTVTVAGATAATDYMISLTGAVSSRRLDRKTTTDGSGGATEVFPVVEFGDTWTVSLRPLTEFKGTTTATATTTFTPTRF